MLVLYGVVLVIIVTWAFETPILFPSEQLELALS